MGNGSCLESSSKFSLRLTRLRIRASWSCLGKARGVRVSRVCGSRMSPVCKLMMNPMNVNELPSSLKNRYGCGLQCKTNTTKMYTTVENIFIAQAILSTVSAMALCLCVCVSVCLFVSHQSELY